MVNWIHSPHYMHLHSTEKTEVSLPAGLFMMFTKLGQCCWIKIQSASGHNAWQCHQELAQDYGESVLPHRTVARWVKVFSDGCQNVKDVLWPGHCSASEEQVRAVSALLGTDWCCTIFVLANQTRVLYRLCYTFWRKAWGCKKLYLDEFHML